METVFDALKAMGTATSVELAARLDISREEVLRELWNLKNAGFVDKSAYTWWVADGSAQEKRTELPEETTIAATATKISEQDLTAIIEKNGPQSADELAAVFGITSRKVASTLTHALSKGRLIRANQNGKSRYCLPVADLPAGAESKPATETSGKSAPQIAEAALPLPEAAGNDAGRETMADFMQSIPSFTEKRPDDLIFPSLRVANRELRRAKSNVQKWQRVCAALRVLNQNKDIVAQLNQESAR